MKIAIYGMGYVGFTAACCLTQQGHHVTGVEVNEEKVKQINAGIAPIQEPGVAEMLKNALDKTLFQAVSSISSFEDYDLVFVCVGTPSAVDGSHNMSFIAAVSRQIAEAIDPSRTTPLTVAYRSTFRPGTMSGLIQPIFENTMGLKMPNACVELVYNPEFLREASAVKDYFNPPKIVIGTQDGQPSAAMDVLNEGLDAPVFVTGYPEAEITKFVDNTWHAVKVAYANEVGRVCHQLGVSAEMVHKIFISDTKLNISPYYTRPGGAFGGSCLPKDVRALQFISREVGASTFLIDSLLPTNEAHKTFQANDIVQNVPKGSKVLMVGLAFKADTDDLRESPNVDIARKLLEAGYDLSIYDPSLKPEHLIGQNLGYAYSYLPTVDGLLIDRETAESENWAAIIGSNKSIETMTFKSTCPIISTYKYD